MTLSCNCDMPIEIYCDWLQDQGWDCDDLRSDEEVVLNWCWYWDGGGGSSLYRSFYGNGDTEFSFDRSVGLDWPYTRHHGSGDGDYRGDAN